MRSLFAAHCDRGASMFRRTLICCLAAAGWTATAAPAQTPATAQIARGEYLAHIMGCTDCHTPGHFTGGEKPGYSLAGSDVGFPIPGLGVFVGPNLTPDKTGLGDWTAAEIATAITTGKTPSGRMLAPVMPWPDFAHLTHDDAMAIAAYLKTVAPVKNTVPGPFGPDQKVTVFVMPVVPAAVYNGLPKPKPPAK